MDNQQQVRFTRKMAVVGVRLTALAFVTLGLWLLLANVLESLGDFNPVYWKYYLLTQLLRPAIAILLGAVLWLAAHIIARAIIARAE